MKHRVVITGIGVASVSGFGKDAFFRNVWKGESHMTPLQGGIYGEEFQGQYGLLDAAELAAYEARYLTPQEKDYAPCCRLTLAAAVEAAEDAGLPETSADVSPLACGVSLGTTHGELHCLEQLLKEHPDLSMEEAMAAMPHGEIAAAIARRLHCSGDVLLHTDACASGNIAAAHAFQMIRSGRLKRVITGGVDLYSMISEGTFSILRALAKEKLRPFDRDRNGIILSEGAAVLVLEKLETALARKAHIYGEIIGQGQSSDAYHMAAMDPEATGILAAMERVTNDAHIARDAIDYICLHGTGTVTNDACEMKAVSEFFGEDASRISASSIKGTLGHALGAAAALELAACAITLDTGVVPPNCNVQNLDEHCTFRLVTQPEKLEPEVVLNSAYAFGGSNSCVLLKKWRGEAPA